MHFYSKYLSKRTKCFLQLPRSMLNKLHQFANVDFELASKDNGILILILNNIFNMREAKLSENANGNYSNRMQST